MLRSYTKQHAFKTKNTKLCNFLPFMCINMFGLKHSQSFFAFSELASTQAAQKIFNNSWIQCFPDGEISSL